MLNGVTLRGLRCFAQVEDPTLADRLIHSPPDRLLLQEDQASLGKLATVVTRNYG